MRRRAGLLVLLSFAFGLLLVIVRGEPRWNGDQGVFLSIAARVLDGDRLYVDVIDNKDPLFFYGHAGALWVGGWRGPAALDGVWLAIAALSMALLLREIKAPLPVVVTGFLVYPFALVAAWYEPGLSMLGGLALAPAIGWLAARERFVVAGSALAVTALLKITVAPLAAAPALAFVALGPMSTSRSRAVARGLLGLTATLASLAVVLALRSELRGYLEVLAFNVRYPDDARQVQGGTGGFASHMDVVLQFFRASGRWQLPLAWTALSFLAVASLLGWRRGSPSYRWLSAAAMSVTASALLVLALTAIWTHHLQLLSFPAALIAALVVAFAGRYGRRVALLAAMACVMLAGWGALKEEVLQGSIARAWSSPRSSVGADLLESTRGRFFASEGRLTYMVLGSNSENAHAVFIDDAFDLECRWFHLYPNNAPEHLTETTDCLDDKRPELVLVTVGFYEPRGGSAAWRAFVQHASRALESRYELVEERDGFQVWRRVGGRAA